MKLTIEHISIILTTIIAVWNIFLQLRLKKMEGQISSKNIKLQAITNQEYLTYKEIWSQIAYIIRKIEYLRLDIVSWDSKIEDTVLDKTQIFNFKDSIKNLEQSLVKNEPFMQEDIVESIQEFIRIVKLESLQIDSTKHPTSIKGLNQAEKNKKELKAAYELSVMLLRKRILE